ncbi:MAG: hypothetical protein R6V49_03735 [Bacteroidales bacterium]
MKKSILFLFAGLLMPICLNAQEREEPRFLFSEGNLFLSGFGGPLAEFTLIGNDFALCNGGGGAFLVNQTFFFGGYGMGLSTSHYRDDMKDITGIDHPKLYFNHSGLWLGYIHNHFKPIHPALSVKLGGGEISLTDIYFHTTPFDERKGVDKVFVVTPQIEVEMNFTPWMKMNVGAGYRFVSGVDRLYQVTGHDPEMYYNAGDFSTPFLNLGFYFGWFNQSK